MVINQIISYELAMTPQVFTTNKFFGQGPQGPLRTPSGGRDPRFLWQLPTRLAPGLEPQRLGDHFQDAVSDRLQQPGFQGRWESAPAFGFSVTF